ncbi:MAG TPA: hypothetical protein VL989_03065 [Candidatus Sulfotelmatobacter sp.]|nr:hypothetical protein [Candidatus Sulfotelmatobacter sp.]
MNGKIKGKGGRILDWSKRHKVWTAVIIIFALGIIGTASSGNSTKPVPTNSSNSSKSTATKTTASSQAKKASFQGYLWATGDSNNIPMTLAAAGGWDNNDGWDSSNAQATVDDESPNGVDPAVIQLNSHELEIYVNVKNTGNAPGTPECQVQASSESGSNFSAGADYGVNEVYPKTLNGSTTIQPGNYGNAVDDLTITNNGAANIVQIKINC